MWRFGPLIVALLFVGSFLFNTITLSGATRIPAVGEGIREVAYLESLPTYAYIRLGDLLNSVGVGGAAAAGFAERTFGGGIERIREQKRLTVEIIYGPQYTTVHGWLRTSLYACPVLLVLALLLIWFKPKRFETYAPKKR